MSDAIKEKVEALIQENPVMVFSKSYCPYCRSTKGTLRSFDAKFKVLELDEVDDGADIQNYLHTRTGQRSVPNTFIGTEHIGGNDALDEVVKQNALKAKLEAAGALE